MPKRQVKEADLNPELSRVQRLIKRQQRDGDGWIPILDDNGDTPTRGWPWRMRANASYLLHSLVQRTGLPKLPGKASTYRYFLSVRPQADGFEPPHFKVEVKFVESRTPFLIDELDLPPSDAWIAYVSPHSTIKKPPSGCMRLRKVIIEDGVDESTAMAAIVSDPRAPKPSIEDALLDDSLGVAAFVGRVKATHPQYDSRIKQHVYVDRCIFRVRRALPKSAAPGAKSLRLGDDEEFEVHIPALRRRKDTFVAEPSPLTRAQRKVVGESIAAVMNRLLGKPVESGLNKQPYEWLAESLHVYSIFWIGPVLVGFTTDQLPPDSGMLTNKRTRSRSYFYGFAPFAQDDLGMLGCRTIHAADGRDPLVSEDRAKADMMERMARDQRASYGPDEGQGLEVFVRYLRPDTSLGGALCGTLALHVVRARLPGGDPIEPLEFELAIPVSLNVTDGRPLDADLREQLSGNVPPPSDAERDRRYEWR